MAKYDFCCSRIILGIFACEKWLKIMELYPFRLLCVGTYPWFSAIITKGDNSCGFLIASWTAKPSLNRVEL